METTAALTVVALRAIAAFAGFGVVAPSIPPVPPPPAPAVGASPAPAAAAAPSPPPPTGAGIRNLRPLRYVPTQQPTVAITFDACATRSHHAGFDRQVFEVLKRERIPTTIFVSGLWVEAHPEEMAELAADPLVEFGDHSYDHPHMSQLSVARIIEQVDQTEAALAKYGKHSVAFRPPFGEWSSRLIYVLQDLRLPTVTWDVVSGDPSAHTTADGMIRTVVGKARPGSIIIFHINGRGWKTAQALPTIIGELRQRGFRFVPLSELMAAGQAAPSRPAPIPPASMPATPMPAVATPGPAGPEPTDSGPFTSFPGMPLPTATIPLPPSPGPGPQ